MCYVLTIYGAFRSPAPLPSPLPDIRFLMNTISLDIGGKPFFTLGGIDLGQTSLRGTAVCMLAILIECC